MTFQDDFPTGYLHPAYAASLSEFGTPRYLPLSGAWILTRRVPGTPYTDGMGLYPITCCRDWGWLREDIEGLFDLVSLVFVIDPFWGYKWKDLGFLDIKRTYKTHYYLDTELDITPSAHHVRAAKRAGEKVDVVVISRPHDALDDWTNLYNTLINHHGIEGITKFSRNAFDIQLQVPGIFAIQALQDNIPCSMLLFYVQGKVAYYHLGASTPEGYEVGASHALFQAAIKTLAPKVRYISLGGGAGLEQDPTDGLTRFKRGWAPLACPSYLGGAILRPAIYGELSARIKGGSSAQRDYFPAYRTPGEDL